MQNKLTIMALCSLVMGCVTSEGAEDFSSEQALSEGVAERQSDCANGSFALQVAASQLTAWEGKRVVLAAREPGAIGAGAARPVLVAGTIRNGAVRLECRRGLSVNMRYPSWAIYVDVNGDGACGLDDHGVQRQYYGWNRSQRIRIQPSEWTPVGGEHADGNRLDAPVGMPGTDFCSGYVAE